MSFVKVMVHAVWSTKSRQSLLLKNIRPVVYRHISENAKAKGIYIDCLNGAEDHIHVLLGLNAELSIAKTIQLIKGESSFWINSRSSQKTNLNGQMNTIWFQ